MTAPGLLPARPFQSIGLASQTASQGLDSLPLVLDLKKKETNNRSPRAAVSAPPPKNHILICPQAAESRALLIPGSLTLACPKILGPVARNTTLFRPLDLWCPPGLPNHPTYSATSGQPTGQ